MEDEWFRGKRPEIGLGLVAFKAALAVDPCDMRKGINGLTITAAEQRGQLLAHDELIPLSLPIASSNRPTIRLSRLLFG